jgi:formylglycine-generating enzyme required for sulfatase activity
MSETRRPCFLASSIGLSLVIASVVTVVRLSIDPPTPARLASEMVVIPAGEFTMGSLKGHPDQRPEHAVYLEAFHIDKYEVTNQQYLQFIRSATGLCEGHTCVDSKAENPDSHIVYQNGRYTIEAGYEQHPVTLVSWYGAHAYCRNQGKQLPSEAEWEKAARGPEGRTYPSGDVIDRARLNGGGYVGDTTPVGNYPAGASPYGVYDLAGNVWEWTADWYLAYPASPHRSPFFGEKYKMVRGGSWNHPVDDARTTVRDIAHPGRRIRVVGFRCARAP